MANIESFDFSDAAALGISDRPKLLRQLFCCQIAGNEMTQSYWNGPWIAAVKAAQSGHA
jgi:hypothetical protein